MLTGHCGCGRVEWHVSSKPKTATACNCSICRRYGVLWGYGYENEGITVTGPTRSYIRDTYIEFHFCETCGCVAYWRSQVEEPDGRLRIAVNLRLVQDYNDVADIPIQHFDGLDRFESLPLDGRKVSDYWF